MRLQKSLVHSNLDLRAINLRAYLNLRANSVLTKILLNKSSKFKSLRQNLGPRFKSQLFCHNLPWNLSISIPITNILINLATFGAKIVIEILGFQSNNWRPSIRIAMHLSFLLEILLLILKFFSDNTKLKLFN